MQIAPDSRAANLAVGIVVAIVGPCILALVPGQISGESWRAIGDVQSPAFFPTLNALFLTLCGLCLLARTAQRTVGRIEKAEAKPASYPATLAVTAATLAIYLVSIKYIGFVVSSVGAIAAMTVVLGYRNIPVVVVCSLISPIVIYFLFEKVLKILLPHGAVF